MSADALYWEGKAVFIANFYLELDEDEEIVVGQAVETQRPAAASVSGNPPAGD